MIVLTSSERCSAGPVTRCLIVFLCLGTWVGSAAADDQVFRIGSKKATRGTVKLSRNSVELTPRSGDPVTIPVDEIDYVRFNAEPPALNQARSAERNGLLQRALESYTKLLPDLKSALARTDTEFLIARTQARMALTDPPKIPAAIQALEKSLAATRSFRHYECLLWIGELEAARSKFDAATTRFAELAKSPMKSHQMAAKVAGGKVLLAQNQHAAAQKEFAAVVAMTPRTAAETASRYEAMLGRARCQQKQQQYDAAVTSLSEVLQNTTPDQSKLQARAFLQRGDCYRDQQQPKRAVIEYLYVELIYNREKEALAEALYQLSQLWGPAGNPDRATAAADRLRKEFSDNNPWKQKLGAG